jgi:hypothetical protein
MPKATTEQVAANLHAHEVKCEERWKTIFKETSEIKDEIAALNKIIRTASFGLLGFTGALIITLLSGILTVN